MAPFPPYESLPGYWVPHAIGTLFSACPQVSDRTIPTNEAFATLPVNGMACQKQSQHCPFLGGPEQKNNKIHVAFKFAASRLLGGISRGDRLDRLRENKKNLSCKRTLEAYENE